MQADYLVITSMDAVLFGEAEQLLVGDIWSRNLFGATGMWDGGLFVGRYTDGRFIASCSGPRSHDLLRVLALSDFDASVARLDLQVTIVVNDADGVIRSITPHPRYKSLLMAPVTPTQKGATLYVGAPGSRKRLRVYNKSAQAGVTPACGEYLRVELQARDSEADYYFAVFRKGGTPAAYQAFRSAATFMAPQLNEVLPHDTRAHIEVEVPQRENNYAYWLEHSVLPAVARAMRQDNPLVKQALKDLKELLSAL